MRSLSIHDWLSGRDEFTERKKRFRSEKNLSLEKFVHRARVSQANKAYLEAMYAKPSRP